MNSRMFALRRITAGLFVVLGGTIAGRGVVGAAPLSFTAMGLLMFALGVYRLRLMSRPRREEG